MPSLKGKVHLRKNNHSRSKGMMIFSIIWAGQLVSTLGSGLTSFALGVWIYEATGSATLFAINMVIWILPNVVLSPVAGVLTDRWDRRLVMLFSDTGAGLSPQLPLECHLSSTHSHAA